MRESEGRKYKSEKMLCVNLIFLQIGKRPQLIDFSGEHPDEAR
jgi:hypothetical protein